MLENRKLTMVGDFTGTLLKSNGEVEIFSKKNMIVQSGFDFICASLGSVNARPAILSHIAVGTGADVETDTVAESDVILKTELARKAATYAHTVGTKSFTMSTTFLPGEATGGITEAGVFNANAAGVMWDRVIFPVINKGADDTFVAQFQFTFK